MFNLHKRINRKNYLLGSLAQFGMFAVIAVIIDFLPDNGTSDFEPIFIVPFILLLPIIWYGITLTRQRANDISGKNALLWFFLGIFITGILLLIIPGERGENRYGLPAPLFKAA